MKFLFQSFLFLTILGSTTFAQGQNQEKIDSILRLINETGVDTVKARNYLELTDITMYNDHLKTFEYIKKAETLYAGTQNYKGEARLYAQMANYYYRLGKIDSVRHHLDNSVNKHLLLGDTLKAAVIRHNIGILDHYQGDSDSAIMIMDKNIPVFENYGDTLHLGNAFLLKGKIAMTNGFLNIALETYKALKMHRDINDDYRIAEDLLQIGIIYQNTGEDIKAIDIFDESIHHYEIIENDQSMAQALNYRADSKIKLKHYDAAAEDLDNALRISKKLEYTANIARVLYNKGLLDYAKGNSVSAIENFGSSLKLWKTVDSPNNEANTLFYLGRSHLQKEEYSKAVDFFDKSIEIATALEDPEILAKVYLGRVNTNCIENQCDIDKGGEHNVKFVEP